MDVPDKWGEEMSDIMISRDRVLSLLGLDHNDYVYLDKRELAKRVEKIKGMDLVRCKDCKHWSGCKSTMHNNHLCGRAENVDYWTKADDYCSYGERSRR